MTQDKNDIQKILTDLNKTNEEAKEFVKKIQKKITEIDLKYAKTLIKHDIDSLKILEK